MSQKITAYLRETKGRKLILRICLDEFQREDYLLEKGAVPKDMIKIVVSGCGKT